MPQTNLTPSKQQTLIGQKISLLPATQSHIDELKQSANHPDIWTYQRHLNTSLPNFLETYFDKFDKALANPTQWAYVVQDNASKTLLGSTRFYDLSFSDLRTTIGYTWYHPSVWGTYVNKEAKQLLLSHAFKDLGFNRVQFQIDKRNIRSQKAVEKLGATFEGCLRQHKIVQEDFVRDTVVYSILRSEYVEAKQ